jgi:hypothetical protein
MFRIFALSLGLLSASGARATDDSPLEMKVVTIHAPAKFTHRTAIGSDRLETYLVIPINGIQFPVLWERTPADLIEGRSYTFFVKQFVGSKTGAIHIVWIQINTGEKTITIFRGA